MQHRDGSIKPTLQAVLEALKELSPEERKRVRYELAQPYDKKKPDMDPDWLLEGIINELVRRGLWPRGMPPENLPKAYREQAPAVKRVLLEMVDRNLTYAEELALGQLVAQALIEYMPPNSRRISLNQLAQSMSSVLPAVEYSYPGYAQSGLMGMLIKRRMANE